MKKVTLKLYGSSLVDIFVNGNYTSFVSFNRIRAVVNELGGEVLVVPSRNGEMSLRFDGGGAYDVYDGNRDCSEYLCQEDVEDAIGKSFRKKPFTFYLREI